MIITMLGIQISELSTRRSSVSYHRSAGERQHLILDKHILNSQQVAYKILYKYSYLLNVLISRLTSAMLIISHTNIPILPQIHSTQ